MGTTPLCLRIASSALADCPLVLKYPASVTVMFVPVYLPVSSTYACMFYVLGRHSIELMSGPWSRGSY